MDARTEFEQLLAALCDGSADTARTSKLNALLREHPEWQADYLDHMQLHALLRWRGGATSAQSTPAEPATTNREKQEAQRRLKRTGVWRSLRMPVSIAVAAGILVAVGFVLLAPGPEAQAAPEVVERLVDWDLDITQAGTADARRTLYDSQHRDLQALVVKTHLSPEDRDLANSLLETGSWLTRNDDPMAEAERFSELADKVLVRLDFATTRDSQQAAKFAESYQRLSRIGVSGNIDRIASPGPFDLPRKMRLDSVIAGHSKRAQKLEDLLNQRPESSYKAIHRALKGHTRKPHPKD
jgi:hypothetical protein